MKINAQTEYESAENAIHWLEQAKNEHPEDTEIDELIEKLKTSHQLLSEVQQRIDELIGL